MHDRKAEIGRKGISTRQCAPLLFARDDACSTQYRESHLRRCRQLWPPDVGLCRHVHVSAPIRPAAGRSCMSMRAMPSQRLQSPTDQVALEQPALRARKLVRLQIAAIVLVSMSAGLLGALAVALPAEARSLPLMALAAVAVLGGIVVGL